MIAVAGVRIFSLKAVARQSAAVIQQHPDRNILISGIRHLEHRQFFHDRFVKRQLAFLHQHHHGRRGEHLADGAD